MTEGSTNETQTLICPTRNIIVMEIPAEII